MPSISGSLSIRAAQSQERLTNIRYYASLNGVSKDLQNPQLKQYSPNGVPTTAISSTSHEASDPSRERVPRRITLDERTRVPSASSSRSSSREAGSEDYDTADEAVPDNADNTPLPNHAHGNIPTVSVSNSDREPPSYGVHVAPDSTKFRTAKPESKIPTTENPKNFRPGQMVGKIFVICCRCKFWHDMPSEVYARLTCPDLFIDQKDPKMSGGGKLEAAKREQPNKQRLSKANNNVSSKPLLDLITQPLGKERASDSNPATVGSAPLSSSARADCVG